MLRKLQTWGAAAEEQCLRKCAAPPTCQPLILGDEPCHLAAIISAAFVAQSPTLEEEEPRGGGGAVQRERTEEGRLSSGTKCHLFPTHPGKDAPNGGPRAVFEARGGIFCRRSREKVAF